MSHYTISARICRRAHTANRPLLGYQNVPGAKSPMAGVICAGTSTMALK
jgi:hypothetical protein